MKEIGKQYPADSKSDPSGFLSRKRLHQSIFRAEVLNLPYETYGNYLTKEDGEKGYNFYNDFGIFQAVKRYRKYNVPLYSNMLRSEHIPFNFFIPLNINKRFCRDILSEFFNPNIKTIDRIEIEYAPQQKERYLNDRTSFDVYIEYTSSYSTRGIIGIEVKYTEREYKLQKKSKQEEDILSKTSRYYVVSDKCKLYKSEAIDILPSDRFRQIWRNHLLGESILIADSNKFRHFTSLTLFPCGNTHFVETSKEYLCLLAKNENNFLPITYEEFFAPCYKHCPDGKYRNWLNYLEQRYIVKG